MLIALIREGQAGENQSAVWQVKKQIVVQCGEPVGLEVKEYILDNFDPNKFEREIAKKDCRAVVCMGGRATETLTGFRLKVGSIETHHYAVDRRVPVLSTLQMADFDCVQEEVFDMINIVKVHLHRLAIASGLVERA